MKILVSVCNTGWIHKRVTFSLLKLQQDKRVTIVLPTWRPYEHGLNRVCKDLKEQYTDYDYWLNIDADNPPINNPLDLVELDKDIIGLPTPVWHDKIKGDQPYYYNALLKEGDGWKPLQEGQGLTEVDVVGSGCMLVHRRVVEAVTRPWFMREYDEDGLVTKGHDYKFCEKAQRAGFKVFTHLDYPCEHYVENDLHSQINSFSVMGVSNEYNGNDPIIVVGPPRSGSSSVAKLLVEMGVYMGDKFLYLGDNALHETGGTYEDVEIANLSQKAVTGKMSKEEWQAKFKTVIDKRKDKWGFKDPRTYKLIDEYLQIFDNPVFVRCHRKKEDVVKSMVRVFEWDENRAIRTYDKIEEVFDEKLKGYKVIDIELEELNNGKAREKIKSLIN